MRKICSLLLTLLLAGSGNGQNLSSRKMPVDKSISKKHTKLFKTQGTKQYANIHCSLQDKAGNLWFGTTGEGVYRYDGKYFTNFTTANGLTNNTVWCMAEDNAGNIWIGTDDGICRFDGKTMSLVSITLGSGPLLPPFSAGGVAISGKNDIWSIMQDSKGRLWFGTKAGLFYYANGSFTRLLDDRSIVNTEGLQLKMIDWMLEDKNGTIWLASGMLPGSEGICRYDGKTLTRFKPDGDGWIRYLVPDKNGNIWIGTRHRGIWRYNGKEFSKFKEGDDIGLSALADRKGNVWFSGGEKDDGYSSDGGFWIYDGKSLKQIAANGIGNYGVWTMLEDRAGNIWFGTRNIGLYRYDGKSFTSFSEEAPAK